ncbi:WD40 repeat [Dillenia turbinata]|uniref:WD40 repeat n=1 Tax=Dillenia turbinata TaxID=194707 RepID=A0AAN8ZI15_9MAGN
MEVVIASSSTDAGIGCWELQTGAEQLRYKSCASPSHGLTSVGNRFLASSQITSSSSGSILYWSWSKPHVEVRSFPAEPIRPLISNSHGTYLIGGGVSGHIYFWEVTTGRLLQKWHAHYRGVTCLALSDDDSLLISGAEDGHVRVWSLFMIFDDVRREETRHLYEHSFSEHTLRVNNVVVGYGGCNAIVVSASDDRTCKVWSLSTGKLLRNIVFPTIIDAIALDPGEHVFYAGSRDGKIFIAALNADCSSSSSYGMHIIGLLSDQSKAVTCLAFGVDGVTLISGSEDGMVRVWDTMTHNITRIFKHSKGPVNNILVVKQPDSFNLPNTQVPSTKRRGSLVVPPLDKYLDFTDETKDIEAVIAYQETCKRPLDPSYVSFHVMMNHIKEFQKQDSSAATEMDVERLKLECKRSVQMVQQWKKLYENLHQFCVNELLDGVQSGGTNVDSS